MNNSTLEKKYERQRIDINKKYDTLLHNEKHNFSFRWHFLTISILLLIVFEGIFPYWSGTSLVLASCTFSFFVTGFLNEHKKTGSKKYKEIIKKRNMELQELFEQFNS